MTRYDTGLLKMKSSCLINILIFSVVFSGCSSPTYQAPIENAKDIPSFKIRSHRVVKGDTVYSIAWRYGLDYRQLARANNLSSSYGIWPGQLLTLDVSSLPKKTPSKTSVKVAKKDKTRPSALKAKPKSTPNVVSPSVISTPVPKAPSLSNVKPTSSKNQSKPKPKRVTKSKKTRGIQWRWSLRGAILVRFDQKKGLNKGIDIAAKLGESVISAARGEVVYAGSGLRGYGKLVIVKHSEKFLSAYAHNRKLLVKEGQRISAGHKIAEVGLGAASNRAQLHFEIRYDGVPVDPLKYLP